PVRSEWSEEVFDKALEVLFEEDHCDLLSFGPVAEEFKPYSQLRAFAESDRRTETIFRESSSAVHCYIDLPESFTEYFESLKSKQRTNLRRRRRQIEEQFGPLSITNLTSWEDIQSEFRSFREMHDRYWHTCGQGGHFVDLVNGEEFTLDLIREAAEKGRVCLQRLTAGDEVVGYQFLFYFGRQVHWRLTARAIGEEWGKLGIGVLCLLLLIEDSIDRGMSRIEAGPGIYEYKTQMGGIYRSMNCLTIGRQIPSCRLKTKCLAVIYKLLDIVYYKIWYQRLVKIFGLSRGAIWQYYLRCRL
ncbi:MAG: GNAT family N-acetyltransferase, partial [Candidatus Omnitrophica bacterium]|nr:GNAT family N-acetyltransferase [Candidatus Omnitrophota bacterium]